MAVPVELGWNSECRVGSLAVWLSLPLTSWAVVCLDKPHAFACFSCFLEIL